jgi:hypothetical protein
MEASGMEIVLSPLQLAAVLEDESVHQSSCLSSVFLGAASVVVGAIELTGAAALLLTPEPTTVTKIAGGALAVHGADTASAGLAQIASCQTRTTLTAQSVNALSLALGADPTTAANVSFVVDVGVPLAAGFAGAARALSVSRGLLSLQAEEAAGGHTLARHIGKTEAELRARLLRQPRLRTASTFHTLADAEYAVSKTLRANKTLIKLWAKVAQVGETESFECAVRHGIGHGVARQTGLLTEMSRVTVVLRKVAAHNRIYFVLTAYPSL